MSGLPRGPRGLAALASDRRLARSGFSFDLHAHPGALFFRGTPAYAGDEGVASRVEDMLAGGMTSGFVSLVADMAVLEIGASGVRPARRFEPGEAWADYRRQAGEFRELIPLLDADVVTTPTDADAVIGRGRVAAFLAVEGGDCLEGRADRLATLYEDGVRSLQLVHYAQNELGDLQTEPAFYDGLSPAGREVVRGMGQLGMVIDVAHAAFTTTRDVVELADAPILLSHSQLVDPKNPHPRHIDAEHARLVAGTGGVIGMWPSGFGNASLDEFVANTFRLIDVVGVDHVGLGTDMDGNYRPVIANYREYGGWISALEQGGLAADEVEKLAGRNARRVLETVL